MPSPEDPHRSIEESTSVESTQGQIEDTGTLIATPELIMAAQSASLTSQINGYEIGALLGRGGFGEVWSARHLASERQVAIKVLRQTPHGPDFSEHQREQLIKQFRAERDLLSRLEHPGLVKTLDHFEHDDRYFIVMERIDGITLRDLIQDGSQPISVSSALEWIDEVARVLGYLHSHDPPIVFCDLKPSNIMLDRGGRIHLIDLGIARTLDGTTTATLIRGAGTPGYAAPEQYSGSTVDSRADIYALGATLYALLTRSDPPVSVARTLSETVLKPPSQSNANVAPELDWVVLKMMAVRRESRYSEVREVRTALTAASCAPNVQSSLDRMDGDGSEASPPASARPPRMQAADSSSGPVSNLQLFLGSLMAIAAAVFLFYLATRPSAGPTRHLPPDVVSVVSWSTKPPSHAEPPQGRTSKPPVPSAPSMAARGTPASLSSSTSAPGASASSPAVGTAEALPDSPAPLESPARPSARQTVVVPAANANVPTIENAATANNTPTPSPSKQIPQSPSASRVAPTTYSHRAFPYYQPFLTGKRQLAFHPDRKQLSEVQESVKREYLVDYPPSQSVDGMLAEVRNLLGEAGIDDDGLHSMRRDEEMPQAIVERYKNQVNEDLLWYAILRGYVRGLNDPWSTLLLPFEFNSIHPSAAGWNNELAIDECIHSGAGLFVELNPATRQLSVIDVQENSPAAQAGILPGDVITAIDGISTNGMSPESLASLMREPVGSRVVVSVERWEAASRDVTVTRSEVPFRGVEGHMLPDGIGYIRVRTFDSAAGFSEAVRSLRDQRMGKLIVDVRNSPGGLVSAVSSICGYFLDSQEPNREVATRMPRNPANKDVLQAVTTPIDANSLDLSKVPVALLINHLTVSEGEVFASFLKDKGLATLIGSTTLGKGVVQNLFPLSDGAAVKLTVARVLSPTGRSFSMAGVTPDIEVRMEPRLVGLGDKDIQLARAVEYLRNR